ncbi:MAG: ankyrin repeat domain-containing protein [Planctomycetaceae bacterium]
MQPPPELTRDEPLTWSRGRGTDVWQMFLACRDGDLHRVQRLVAHDAGLVRCQWQYRTPLYFAVRENRADIAAFLLDHGADPLGLAVNDTLLQICQDRGSGELERLLRERYARLQGATDAGEPVAAAIRAHDHASVAQRLDENPALLHTGDARSNQPIHWATMTRQPVLVDLLLARGANLEARRADGARPIHLVNGDYHFRGRRDVPADWPVSAAQMLDHLLERGAQCDLGVACHRGDLPRVREILAADPGAANRLPDYVTYYLGSGAPLKNAAQQGHLEIVQLLLDHGADPNLREEEIAPRGHALYAAAANGHLAIAQLLLEHGAYPNPEVESSADALTMAIDRGDTAMVNLLCRYGASRRLAILGYYGDVRVAAAVLAANPRLADDPEALANAAGEGQLDFVRLLLKYEPTLPRQLTFPPWSPAGQSAQINELLFAHGLDPNATDWLGITALHRFAGGGHLDWARQWVARGAQLDPRDEDLCSRPLGWAAKFGRLELVRWLLEAGSPARHPDDPAWATPLAWAERRGHAEIAQLLRDQGG